MFLLLSAGLCGQSEFAWELDSTEWRVTVNTDMVGIMAYPALTLGRALDKRYRAQVGGELLFRQKWGVQYSLGHEVFKEELESGHRRSLDSEGTFHSIDFTRHFALARRLLFNAGFGVTFGHLYEKGRFMVESTTFSDYSFEVTIDQQFIGGQVFTGASYNVSERISLNGQVHIRWIDTVEGENVLLHTLPGGGVVERGNDSDVALPTVYIRFNYLLNSFGKRPIR